MIRSQPMFIGTLRILRRELLEGFSDQQLLIWRSKGWQRNPVALLDDLNKLPQRSLTPPQWELITRAHNALLLSHRNNEELWSVARVSTLLRLTKSGLKFATAGKKRSENKQFALQRRNLALRQLAAEKLAKNPDLSASKIGKDLATVTVAAKFKKRGLLPPPSKSIRKIIAETVKSKRSPRRSSGPGSKLPSA